MMIQSFFHMTISYYRLCYWQLYYIRRTLNECNYKKTAIFRQRDKFSKAERKVCLVIDTHATL